MIPTTIEKLISSIPGHVIIFSLLVLFWKVDITGEKAHVYKYFPKLDLD